MGLSTAETIAVIVAGVQAGVWTGITYEAKKQGRPVLAVAGDLFMGVASLVRREPAINITVINVNPFPEDPGRRSGDWEVVESVCKIVEGSSASEKLLQLSDSRGDVRSLGWDGDL